MMDGVEAPEPRKPVKGAVDPILRKVRQDQHSQELGGERQGSEQGEVTPGKQRIPKDLRWKQRRPAEGLYQQVAQQEMNTVGRPLRPEDLLTAPERKGALEWHEDQGKHEQVEREPFESKPELRLDGRGQRHGGAAQGHGGHSQEDAGQPKDLPSPARNAEQPQQDRSDQGRLQHPTEEGDRVMRSKDRRGEKPGKVQAEHAKEAERASEHRTNPGYPPGGQVGRLGIAEDAPEVSVERRRRGVGRTHATSLVEPAVWERN